MITRVLNIVERIDDQYGGPAKSITSSASLFNKEKQFLMEIWAIKGDEKVTYTALEKSLITSHLFDKSHSKFKYLSFSFIKFAKNNLIKDKVDIVHLHSIWSAPTIVAACFAIRRNISIVISPRSSLMFSSMSKNYLLKKFLFHLVWKKILNDCQVVITTSQQESEDLRKLGYMGPIKYVPNPVDMAQSYNFEDNREGGLSILYVGRLNPRKRIIELLNAVEGLFIDGVKFNLRIIGDFDDENYKRDTMKAYESCMSKDNIEFIHHQIHSKLMGFYDEADVFVSASKFENYGMTIAESLTRNIPTIISINTPWQELQLRNAGRFIMDDKKIEMQIYNHLIEYYNMSRSEYKASKKAAYQYSQDVISSNVVFEELKIIYGS
jgi:glycosyltransferase involved in cell wall biosynthesis